MLFYEPMQTERSFVSAHHPEVLHTKSKKQLFKEVIEAEHNRVKHNMVDYLSAFLNSEGYRLYVEKGEAIDPNKPLVVALNHHSRQRYFTTEESLRAVAIASVSARNEAITDKHIAWMIRKLPIPLVGVGKLARQVQNATGTVFDSLPATTVKKFSLSRGLYETMTKPDTDSLNIRIANRVLRGDALGSFPEQEPSFELRPYHINFANNVHRLRAIAPEYQVASLAVFYEGKLAHAIWGPVINVDKQSDHHEKAGEIMLGIAAGMPRDLRGHYAKSLQSQ